MPISIPAPVPMLQRIVTNRSFSYARVVLEPCDNAVTPMSSTETVSAPSARPISSDNHFKIARRDKPLKVPFRLIANASSQAVRSRPYNTLEDLTDWPRDSGYRRVRGPRCFEEGGGRPRLTNMLGRLERSRLKMGKIWAIFLASCLVSQAIFAKAPKRSSRGPRQVVQSGSRC